MAEIIRKYETERGLSKQLLANFQTENSCDHKYSRLKSKMELLIKKTRIAMTELIKSSGTSMELRAFFISNTFISNTRLKFAKKRAKSKQHPQAELLLFENHSLSSSMLSSKNSRVYSKKCAKNQVCLFKWDNMIKKNQ